MNLRPVAILAHLALKPLINKNCQALGHLATLLELFDEIVVAAKPLAIDCNRPHRSFKDRVSTGTTDILRHFSGKASVEAKLLRRRFGWRPAIDLLG
ncbi:MAG TPA: hypothetical protein VND64_16945 [Pirellulales bacterium]|nr:hypothetical protein [Pirellulales bacterium]